jgi:hypothetical protein
MNAIKKQRDKHSSRSADLRLRQPVLVEGNRLASATPATTPSEQICDFKTKYGNSGRNVAFFAASRSPHGHWRK